ncbi:PE domain-containing protein [Mycolicibacterium tusciae]|uniref:PE domain-containing protein n=1 Tax=Mycolicibacterium tusciae TaxID=75922 RepID=UPI00024A2E09|nr:PE domain-containing protein [Mycolicibacterium tusciae]
MGVPIGVDPALLGMLSAAEAAGAGRMAAGTSGAAPVMTTVLPPGSDPASMAAAAALNGRGAAAVSALTQLTMTRAMFAGNVGVNGTSYAAMDVLQQTALAI